MIEITVFLFIAFITSFFILGMRIEYYFNIMYRFERFLFGESIKVVENEEKMQ